MLRDRPFYANVPVADVAVARQFYEGALGIAAVRVSETEVVYRSGGAKFSIYPTSGAGKATHTLGAFIVDDIEAEVAALRAKGVTFDEYDLPGLKTEHGIATFGPDRVAWFKDPDGNILALTEEGTPTD